MIITLNDALEPTQFDRQLLTSERLGHKLGYHVYSLLSKTEEAKLVRSIQGTAVTNDRMFALNYLHMASKAYSAHNGLEVAPHDLWYIILTEISTLIKKNPESCRALFTNQSESEGKKLILVQTTDPELISLPLIMAELKKLCPIDIGLFQVDVSTHTEESRLAHMAAFADGMQAFYDYGMFCCGIPKIRLTGTPEDWHELAAKAHELADTFQRVGSPTIAKYLADSHIILTDICNTFAAPDQNVEFWTNIFTQQNVGSGGDMVVSGWLRALWYDTKNGKLLKTFPHTAAMVRYKNFDTGIEYVTVHGAFEVETTEDNFLRAKYGNFIYQIGTKPPAKAPGTDIQQVLENTMKVSGVTFTSNGFTKTEE